MFPPKGSGPRSTLEEMLESIRTGVDMQEKENLGYDKQDVRPPPLPVRPTSRARLPSSVRARKHPGAVTNTLATPTKVPTAGSLGKLCVADADVDSPIGKVGLPADDCHAHYSAKCVMGSEVSTRSPFDMLVAVESSRDPAYENGHVIMPSGGADESNISSQEQSSFSFSMPEHIPALDTAIQQNPIPVATSGKKRKDDGTLRLKKNLRVWCLNSENIWISGTVLSAEDTEAVVRTSDQQVIRVSAAKIQPANPDILEGVDDLIKLSYLNEPSVLHDLDYRYALDKIYTSAGPVLIAVNPFKKVPIYGPDNVQAYRKRTTESSHPHVYMTADSAFEAMIQGGINQSIIIRRHILFTLLFSGESGAGKTETAKIAMQYLAALGGGGGIENEILQTNPILEAFGNAKTLRNDNSSRFGKLIDIYFDKVGKICGAKIQTYLLEKSRVVQQAEGERSYHVFYQLCAGADTSLRDRLNLRPAKEYRYLNQSSCMAIDKVDDTKQFELLRSAMNVVQISEEDQEQAFEMLAAVLWIGNITFCVVEQDNHITVDNHEAVEMAATLLHCKVSELVAALSTRRIRAGGDDIVQRLTHAQATDSRDALAKAIYASLFDWLVDRVNKSLEVGKKRTGRSISILDIYGFESFQRNSFEQLCINYANERLQQHFNRHLFKLEQEEYNSESIDWTMVDFEDNQECLDLIERRPLGMISLLDEECTFPRASDITLANKLKEHLKGNLCFRGEHERTFRICHYAGEVVYETNGFLEKNRDLLHADLLQLLGSCDCALPQLFVASIGEGVQKLLSPTRRANSTESQKLSVATKFKGQLYNLMQRLETTEPHFIRCIKPNTKQLPNVYEQELVLQQLRCCGVLEVVRISRSGYPTRHSHHEFAKRYGFLLPKSHISQEDPLSICVAILHQFRIPSEMYQVGITKLFFRAGQIGILEDLRQRTLQGVTRLQAMYKGYKVRLMYRQKRKMTIYLQSLVRGAIARRLFEESLRRHRGAVYIQKHARRLAACRACHTRVQKIVKVQSVARMWLAKRQLQICITESNGKLEAQEKLAAEAIASDETRQTEESAAPSAVDEGYESVKEVTGIVTARVLSLYPEALELEEKETTIKVSPPYILELQRRAVMAEQALREREEDNALLLQKIQQYEARWMEYEAKMSSMEEVWQKQMSSLQISLAAAKKSLVTDEATVPTPPKEESVDSRPKLAKHHRINQRMLPPDEEDFDWEDAGTNGTKSVEQITNKYLQTGPEYGTNRSEGDAGRAVVSQLVGEYEHRRQVFNDDVDFLVEVKSGQTEAHLSPEEELRKLKGRFDVWRKDFKVRLRETKAVLHKLCQADSVEKEKEKSKKKWWGKRTTP